MASPWVGQTSTYVLGETYAWSHNALTPTWSSAARVGAFGAAPCLHVGALPALCLGQIRGAAARKITPKTKGLPLLLLPVPVGTPHHCCTSYSTGLGLFSGRSHVEPRGLQLIPMASRTPARRAAWGGEGRKQAAGRGEGS